MFLFVCFLFVVVFDVLILIRFLVVRGRVMKAGFLSVVVSSCFSVLSI